MRLPLDQPQGAPSAPSRRSAFRGRGPIAETATVVIVTRDSDAVIGAALESIPESCRIICVDNGSRDHTREIVARSRALLIDSENIGFGRGCNVGALAAETEFLLFMNPDVCLEHDTVDELIGAAAQYPDASVFTPRIVGSTRYRDRSRIERWKARGRSRSGVPVGDCCTGFVDGSVFLIRRSCFNEIGGFDPNIFLYYEDDDFSYRLCNQKRAIVYVHSARARHLVSSSSPTTTASLIQRGQAKKTSEYYVKAKYSLPAHPLIDAITEFGKISWYGLTLNTRRMNLAIGRLRGIAGTLSRGGVQRHGMHTPV